METDENKYVHYNRRYMIGGAIIVLILIYVVFLFFMQIVSDDYKRWADSNAFQKRTLFPSRGVIYDRNGKLLVYNQPSYEVMVIMREVEPFDTLDFCKTLNITKESFNNRIAAIKNRNANSGYSYIPQVFMSQLPANEFGVFQEKLFKFPGFYIRNHALREYGCTNAANVLGSIAEVSKSEIEKDDYYVPGDYLGKSGVERSYEKILRGEKGVEILLRDVHGRIKGKYEDGKHDVAPVSGKSVTMSIDMNLQEYGEKIMQNKQGAIVMIEPSTGEILCLVTAPSYDPALLVIGRERGKNHQMLEGNPLNPLLDRSIMGSYSPGSTFKPAQGLILLQEHVITKESTYTCANGYPYLGGRPMCHSHFSPLSLIPALATSCNSFFCWGLRGMLDTRSRYSSIQEAFDVWKEYMVKMGYGYPLGVDLPGEHRGYIPNSMVYNRAYNNRWNSSSIISIAIGQGEINATPLQICNLAATIANRGYYITPHVVNKIQDMPLNEQYTTKKYTGIETEYYKYVVEGMRAAVTGGTCRNLALYNMEVCGKTGTVENPHGISHSACIAFAPMNNPKIAICVYVQNGGYGAEVAVPMARLMLEKFFYGGIPADDKWNETRMLNLNTLPGSRNYLPRKEPENGNGDENENGNEGQDERQGEIIMEETTNVIQ